MVLDGLLARGQSDRTQLRGVNAASLGLPSALHVHCADVADAAVGGSLLSAAELESSKQYLQLDSGEWRIAHLVGRDLFRFVMYSCQSLFPRSIVLSLRLPMSHVCSCLWRMACWRGPPSRCACSGTRPRPTPTPRRTLLLAKLALAWRGSLRVLWRMRRWCLRSAHACGRRTPAASRPGPLARHV